MSRKHRHLLFSGLSALMAVTLAFSFSLAVKVSADTGYQSGAPEESGDCDSAGGRLILEPEDIELDEEWILRDPLNESRAWSSNNVSGVTITRDVSATGILSFTPPGAGGIAWSDDWSWFWTSDIADLMPGDVIAYPEDEMEGWLVNHIAVVVDVDRDNYKWFKTADGNYTTDTGVHITYRTDFNKRNSNFNRVCVWRHAKNGFDIADSAWAFTRNIVWNHDTSIMDEYESRDMNWCNCYATELLLHVEKTTGFIRVTNNILFDNEPREFEITLKDRNGKPVNGTFDDCKFENGKFRVTLNRGANIKISGITSGFYYTVTETSGQIPREYHGYIRDAVDAKINFSCFTDLLDPNAQGFKYIYWAADNEIVRGYSDGSFRPYESCTRANFVIMLYRIAGSPGVSGDVNVWFKDIDSSVSYYKAIEWAVSRKIIKGFADGTFRPDEPLTRAQILVMLWRYNEMPEHDPDSAIKVNFSDVPKGTVSFDAIRWGAEEEVVKGYGDGTFRPEDQCTRLQVMVILFRADDVGAI